MNAAFISNVNLHLLYLFGKAWGSRLLTLEMGIIMPTKFLKRIYLSQKNQGAGSRLVNALIGTLSQNKCTRIRVIARDTSTGFFRKLGFTTSPGEAPEHPALKKHRITFELMEKNFEPVHGL